VPCKKINFSQPERSRKKGRPGLSWIDSVLNPLNPELNPICYLLALLGAHRFLHVSRIRVKVLKTLEVK